ncbi:MAG: ABC transporter substrate-binding protein [Dehalococcoidia bacterium]
MLDNRDVRATLFGGRDARVGRRAFVRGATLAGAGVAAAALIGCGSDDEDEPGGASPSPGATGTAAGAAFEGITTTTGRQVPYQFPEPSTAPKSGGTITQRYTFDPGQLDPTLSAAGGTLTAANGAYDRLINVYGKADADPLKINQLEPGLAARWESSPDGLTHTFQLQTNVKWQNIAPLNGRAFVAEDARFALNRYKSEGVHQQYFTEVDSMTTPDTKTLVIKLKRPQPDFIFPLSTAYTTIHPKEIVDDGSIKTRAIGTGPMILEKWQAGTGGSMVRNPDYWQGPTLIDRFELPYMLDASAGLAAFRVGQVDWGVSAATEADLDSLLSTNPDAQYYASPLFGGTFSIAFNNELPLWADERLRRAVSLGVDRDTLSTLIYGPFGRVIPVVDYRFFWDEEPTVESGRLGKWWRYDPAEAKQLLSAAGQENFGFEMIYYNYTPEANRRQNEVLVDQMRAAGIQLKATSVEYSEFNSQWTTRKGSAQAYDGWLAFNPTAQHYVFGLHHSTSSGNRYRIHDAEIDAWAEQHAVELNPAARKELAQKVWNKVFDQVYRVDKPTGQSVSIQQPWVRGLRTGRGIGSGQHYLDIQNLVRYMWVDK